jgi:pimeloyl-ACP methyl ester carboxylesterase
MEAEDPSRSSGTPEPWTPPAIEPAHRTLTADDGVRLHYLEWPAEAGAPVLLMVHGRRAHAHWFDPVASHFCPQYLCVCPDLRGHGDSGLNGPASLPRFAADLAQLMGQYSGRRLILLAHSFAGRPAILARQLFGVEPDALILADTPIYRRPGPEHFENTAKARTYPTREEAVSRFRLLPPANAAHPDLLRYIAERSVSQRPDGSWGWRYEESTAYLPFGMDFPEPEELDLEGFECPVLVMYGERSTLIGPEEAETVALRFADPTLCELAGGHHHLMLDQPARFNETLEIFFEQAGLAPPRGGW